MERRGGGGGTSCNNGSGCGTVFSLTTSGKESILYRFTGGADGQGPSAALVNVDNALYGTTTAGGSTNCYGGCGTVFKVTTSGAETVLHRFAAVEDGDYPGAALLNINGTLYGTTEAGGGATGCDGGCGTVFSIRS